MSKDCDCVICKWVNNKISDVDCIETLHQQAYDYNYRIVKLEQENKKLKSLLKDVLMYTNHTLKECSYNIDTGCLECICGHGSLIQKANKALKD